MQLLNSQFFSIVQWVAPSEAGSGGLMLTWMIPGCARGGIRSMAASVPLPTHLFQHCQDKIHCNLEHVDKIHCNLEHVDKIDVLPLGFAHYLRFICRYVAIRIRPIWDLFNTKETEDESGIFMLQFQVDTEEIFTIQLSWLNVPENEPFTVSRFPLPPFSFLLSPPFHSTVTWCRYCFLVGGEGVAMVMVIRGQGWLEPFEIRS